MAVLKTTSPTVVPGAPMARPRNTDPSARTRTAASVLAVIFEADTESGKGLPPSRSLKQGLYALHYLRPSTSLQANHIPSGQAHPFRPSASNMSYRPAGFLRSHFAARTAPAA